MTPPFSKPHFPKRLVNRAFWVGSTTDRKEAVTGPKFPIAGKGAVLISLPGYFRIPGSAAWVDLGVATWRTLANHSRGRNFTAPDLPANLGVTPCANRFD
jgi:hypothetical protein